MHRISLSAGEPLTPEIIKAWKEGTGLDIYEFYGQSETVALLANFRCKAIKYGSISLPTPGHTMAVVEAAVIGIPVEKQTEIIKAFVQLKSTYSPSEKLSRGILDYLGRYLESRKRPRELEFTKELPKTTTGKIRRSELKNREIERRKGK